MIAFDPGSFKDPAGRVFYHRDAVCRTMSGSAADAFAVAEQAGLIRELVQARLLVESDLVRSLDLGLAPATCGELVLQQRKIPVVSYSYEWSFEMLRDAALVTLQVLERALRSGFILKDGTSFNILFDGTVPLLVDAPSIERYVDGTLWAGYGQFCRCFLFPLVLAAYRDVDVQMLLRGSLGEIPVRQAALMTRARDYLRGGVFKDILLQDRLERRFAGAERDVRTATALHVYSKDLVLANVKRLSRIIAALRPPARANEWSRYERANSYSADDVALKESFVRATLTKRTFTRIVDLGANTGTYSQIALESGASVVAVDVDPHTIDVLYRRVAGTTALSPLVVNLLNPTPAMGWELAERRPLFERIRADGFLALALIHHLRITGGVPFDRIAAQLFAIAPEGIVEWVDKDDTMAAAMLSLRPDVYDDYDWSRFEAMLSTQADILAIQTTHEGRRRLCHVQQRVGGHSVTELDG